MNSNAKKGIAAFAALQILVFHCWIPVFSYVSALGNAERFLIAATYSGVDLFFFISAYSLASRPVENYTAFIKNRTIKLMPLFIIALVFGHFLWFIPSIMILYLVFPPLFKVCRKRPVISFFLLLAGWAAITFLILGVIKPRQDIGIFLFRIPSMILGAYAPFVWNRIPKGLRLAGGIMLFAAGLILAYRFGYLHRLNVPFKGTFYLTGIPMMLGSALLIDLISEKKHFRLAELFGSASLEIYFTQVVFGTLIVGAFFDLTGSRILTNISSFTAVFGISLLIQAFEDRFLY